MLPLPHLLQSYSGFYANADTIGVQIVQHSCTCIVMTWFALRNICVTNDNGYVPCPFLIHDISPSLVTRVTQRVPLVEQELPTLPEQLISPPIFSGVCIARSFAFYLQCFVDRCLSLKPFSFGHCVVCPFLIYGFRSPLLYLQTFLLIIELKYGL